MKYLIDCKVNGENLYENRDVYVIYRPKDNQGWFIDWGIPDSTGKIEISRPIFEGQSYWIGCSFGSVVKTFPLKEQGSMNKLGRVSQVHVYLKGSHGGEVLVSDEKGQAWEQKIKYESEIGIFSGKKVLDVATGYGEEISITVQTDDYRPFNILAIDAKYAKYEG